MNHRVMLTGASGTLGRNILELVAVGSDIDVLALQIGRASCRERV